MIGTDTTRHPTLVDQLVDHVFRRIIAGRLKPGQRITEQQLAADFGVSRTPVREAVKRLAEIGVMVVHPRARLEVVSVDEQEIREINQLREELEAMALRLAAPRMTAEDLAELRRIVDRCERLSVSSARPDVFREDSRFHLAIAARSGNRHLCDALGRLDVKVQLCRAFACVSREKIRANVRVHRDILAALERGDTAGAERVLREHIRATLA